MGKAAQRGSHVQAEPRAPAQPPPPDAPAPPSALGQSTGWGWSVMLFLWATTFAFMLIYELLSAALKAAARLF